MPMRRLAPCSAVLATSLLLGGCGLVYKVNVQQGNILDQEMIDQLEPGMTKSQVRMVLGTPAIADPFHRDQWDYIATFSPDGEEISRKHFRVVFEDNRLVRTEGDYFPSDSEQVASAPEEDEDQTQALVEQALEQTSEEDGGSTGPVGPPQRPPQDGPVGGPIPPTDDDPSGR